MDRMRMKMNLENQVEVQDQNQNQTLTPDHVPDSNTVETKSKILKQNKNKIIFFLLFCI